MYHVNVSQHMKATTIRGFKHDTKTVLGWVAAGESVEIRRRSQPIALLSPLIKKGKILRPDFAARLQGIYGDKILLTTATDLISESRGES
jgi:antitoxin (DNA-binding transcriptional repressor) of toxin-antitoxin stability system